MSLLRPPSCWLAQALVVVNLYSLTVYTRYELDLNGDQRKKGPFPFLLYFEPLPGMKQLCREESLPIERRDPYGFQGELLLQPTEWARTPLLGDKVDLYPKRKDDSMTLPSPQRRTK
ncbi:hypothetical protein RYX36_009949 [Vicia faba]